MIEIPQNEPGSAGNGNRCDHGRRGRVQLKSDPGLRLSQQPTAKRVQGTASQEHQDDRHRLFIDKHTLSQKRVNRFQKIVEIKAAPSNDLDLPEGSYMQGIISIHECILAWMVDRTPRHGAQNPRLIA
jgi:hypothetical protein